MAAPGMHKNTSTCINIQSFPVNERMLFYPNIYSRDYTPELRNKIATFVTVAG